MKTYNFLAALIVFLSFSSGCAAGDSGTATGSASGASEKNELQAPQAESLPLLKFELSKKKQKKLTATEKQIYQSVVQNKEIQETDLSMALVDSYAKKSEKNKKKRAKLIKEVSAFLTNLTFGSLHELKLNYESQIEKKFRKEIIYNKDESKPLSLFRKGVLQCYSGSAFFELARRFSTVSQSEHSVMIATSGHVLPGYLIWENDRKWHLYGIETTAAGAAKIHYGAVADGFAQTLRVIDASYFALLEIFSPHMTDAKKVLAQALKNTADAYGIKDVFYGDDGKSKFENPFFFGDLTVPSGDLARIEVQEPEILVGAGKNAAQEVTENAEGATRSSFVQQTKVEGFSIAYVSSQWATRRPKSYPAYKIRHDSKDGLTQAMKLTCSQTTDVASTTDFERAYESSAENQAMIKDLLLDEHSAGLLVLSEKQPVLALYDTKTNSVTYNKPSEFFRISTRHGFSSLIKVLCKD